jgi:hypothetical protein
MILKSPRYLTLGATKLTFALRIITKSGDPVRRKTRKTHEMEVYRRFLCLSERRKGGQKNLTSASTTELFL